MIHKCTEICALNIEFPVNSKYKYIISQMQQPYHSSNCPPPPPLTDPTSTPYPTPPLIAQTMKTCNFSVRTQWHFDLYFRLRIPPFVKARTALEGLKPQNEYTMNVKEEPRTEAEEVMMMKVLVMNQSYSKLQSWLCSFSCSESWCG